MIIVPASSTAITLVYGQDSGTTGDPGTGGTPNGIEDIVVTKQYKTAAGTTLKASDSKVIDLGDSFTDVHPAITGYTYQGYSIDGGTMQTGEPSFTAASGDLNTTVTYLYSPNSYNINIEYKLRDGTQVPGTTNYTTMGVFNTTFTPTVPTFSGYVLGGWKLNGITMPGNMPSITVPAATVTITLVYGYDRGTTGDDSASPSGPDGIEDIIVTKEFLKAGGTTLRSSQQVIVNMGDTFTDIHDTMTGYDYQGYKIDGGMLQSGEPRLYVGAITRAATTVTGSTTVSYVYKTIQYPVTVKVVDESGSSIGNGAYDWTASKGYQESFTAAAPTIQEYTYQSWKLNGVLKSGSIEISSIEAAVTILMVYKADTMAVTPDYGNYEFIKVPNVKNVAAGETVKYTFTNFGNNWLFELQNYNISDIPDKGLDFISASLPAFKGGSGVTYDIIYRTNKVGTTTLYSDVPADQAFGFKAPTLSNGEYIILIELRFGTVPSGFAVGDSMTMTFKVWDNPPSETLTNIGILGYTAAGEYIEFITGGASGSITIGGYFETPKTGDDNGLGLWLALMMLSLGGAILLPVARRRRKRGI